MEGAPEVVDAPGTELEVATGEQLFRTSDPALILREAMRVANELMPVVRQRGMVANISGKEYLTVEAWQTLGAMLGVTPVCDWTRKLDNGWEARVEAHNALGRVIGAAEAECLRDEQQWTNADDYAVRSMAQTRATSKALASVLRFVATLGGVQGTPAEEMPRGGAGGAGGGGDKPPSAKQMEFYDNLLKKADGIDDDTRSLLRAYAGDNLTGGRGGTMSAAIDHLKEEPDKYLPRLLDAAREWERTYSEVPGDTRDFEDRPDD